MYTRTASLHACRSRLFAVLIIIHLFKVCCVKVVTLYSRISYIDENGVIDVRGIYVNKLSDAVRPALWIDIGS